MSPDPTPSAFDFDDPDTPREAGQSVIRALLTRRINTTPQPSRALNQLHATQERCVHTAKQLGDLAGRAPRILSMIRRTLREAFALDPDTLLFSEPPPPQPASHIDSLTDRALALFRDPGVPINLHHFTALSLKDEPGRALPFNATQAMARVSQLGLAARVNHAMTGYWEQLAHGSWLSRRDRWVELRKALFADQAYLAHQLFQLSSAGYAMARQLVDAPSAEARQRAGGAWASLQVRSVSWPHTGTGTRVIPGALHLSREGAADGLQVIYLPGLQCAFHEFGSWRQVQSELPTRVQAALLSVWWQYLALKRQAIAPLHPGTLLRDDALAHSAQAVLEGQWNNEWGSVLSLDYSAPRDSSAPLPSRRAARLSRFIENGRKRLGSGLPFESSLDELLEWDHLRRQPEILLASLSPDLPHNERQQQVRRYETALEGLLVANDPAADSAAYQAFLTLERERQSEIQLIERCTQGEAGPLFQAAFWLERPDGTRRRAAQVLNAQRRALRQEAQLAHALMLIKQAHLDRLLEVLNQPLATQRAGSDTRVLRVAVGNGPQALYSLMGVCVVTTARALAEPNQPQPVVLVVSGSFGGLAMFEHLDDLSQGLRASLASRDGSVLWRCIGRDVRSAARFAMTKSVHVDYSVVEHDVLYEDFKLVVRHYARLEKSLQEPTRLFSEVSDPTLGRLLLADELRAHLQVPANEVRTLALVNVGFLRFAAGQAKNQPAWLAEATLGQRKSYKRLQRRYLANAMALERRLWHVLPPLDRFARQLLLAQLAGDGFATELDVDAPLLEMPDDVSAHFCGWSSQCVVGDRQVKKIASPERSTFSLLELALHNLDPQAPWTEWRLNRARYLQPAWKDRLSPRYLIKTLSALDIGGQYNRLIQAAFHPASSALPRALIDRVTEQLAQMQGFSAARQALSASGQSLFNTVMTARTHADLNKNGHQASLCFVRLRGYTLEHDRHIAGLLVIRDRTSQRCLVYWPSALDYPVLAEHDSLALASAALNRTGATPQNVRALAQRVAPGWEDEALASYPGYQPVAKKPVVMLTRLIPRDVRGYAILQISEAIRRFVRSFKIKHKVPAAELAAIEAQIKEQIDAAPTAWLEMVCTSHSDARALFAHARVLEVQQRTRARATSREALAQYREHRLGEQWDATVRGLLSFVPVIGVGISLYEVLLAARRYHLDGRPEDAVDVAFLTLMVFVEVLTSFLPTSKTVRAGVIRRGLNQLHRRGTGLSRLPSAQRPAKVLERFERSFSTDGAVPLQGPGERGVYVKNGEQFLVEGELHYPVYRRGDELGFRLKSPEGEAQGELILNIQSGREWSLGADAPPPSPQPGPSSAMWRPFTSPDTTAWQPPSHAVLEQAMRQARAEPRTFASWAVAAEITLVESLPEQGIFEVSVVAPEQSYRVLGHNGRYYRVLPDGAQVSSRRLVFITRDQPLTHAASLDLAYWLEVGLFDQPIPATFGASQQWSFHRPLFNESLRISLIRTFPSLTANSRTYLIARLLELSDPSRSLTATHLLALKATLERWLAPSATGQTDDLLRLLRPLHSSTRTSIYIGNESTTPGFDRVDFTPRQIPHISLRLPSPHNLSARSLAMQHAVREVLEQQGFIVRAVDKNPSSAVWVDFSCTHPQSNNHYYVLTRWANTSSIQLHAAQVMQLTDAWFALKFTKRSYDGAFIPIKQAMDEHRLVRIVAGIQWTPTAPPTVFFVRFGSLKPGAATPRPQRRKRPHSPG